MAPMIDMVFLLLVFFMTVSTLSKEARPEVDLPVSDTSVVPEEAPPRDILTLIPGEDAVRIFWHNRVVGFEELGKLLKAKMKEASGHELLVRGPPELAWETLDKVLKACREAGIGDIVIATYER